MKSCHHSKALALVFIAFSFRSNAAPLIDVAVMTRTVLPGFASKSIADLGQATDKIHRIIGSEAARAGEFCDEWQIDSNQIKTTQIDSTGKEVSTPNVYLSGWLHCTHNQAKPFALDFKKIAAEIQSQTGAVMSFMGAPGGGATISN